MTPVDEQTLLSLYESKESTSAWAIEDEKGKVETYLHQPCHAAISRLAFKPTVIHETVKNIDKNHELFGILTCSNRSPFRSVFKDGTLHSHRGENFLFSYKIPEDTPHKLYAMFSIALRTTWENQVYFKTFNRMIRELGIDPLVALGMSNVIVYNGVVKRWEKAMTMGHYPWSDCTNVISLYRGNWSIDGPDVGPKLFYNGCSGSFDKGPEGYGREALFTRLKNAFEGEKPKKIRYQGLFPVAFEKRGMQERMQDLFVRPFLTGDDTTLKTLLLQIQDECINQHKDQEKKKDDSTKDLPTNCGQGRNGDVQAQGVWDF